MQRKAKTQGSEEGWGLTEQICLCRFPPASKFACTNESETRHSRKTHFAKAHKNLPGSAFPQKAPIPTLRSGKIKGEKKKKSN